MTAGLLRIVMLVFLACAVAIGAADEASAQERPRTLFDMLFNKKPATTKRATPRKKSRVSPARTAKKQTASRTTARTRSVEAAEPAPEVVQKIENARVVLVVGDFLGGAMADGLTDTFAVLAGVRVVDKTNGSSGMVRDDYYDWPGSIASIIAEEKPSVVIMMVGSNDRQKLSVGGSREDVGSPEWNAEYDRRLSAFAKTVTDAGIPLLWAGMIPFKSPSMTADMLAFNTLYRTAAENVGGQFIDVWDGFADAEGKYTSRGPDINGRDTQLRASDGINVTKAGRAKLAFYGERALRKLLGNALDPDIGTLTKENLPALVLNPIATPDTGDRTAPIALADPAFDSASSGELLGETVTARTVSVVHTPASDLLVRGLAPDPQPGRVDDHAWPPRDLPKPGSPEVKTP